MAGLAGAGATVFVLAIAAQALLVPKSNPPGAIESPTPELGCIGESPSRLYRCQNRESGRFPSRRGSFPSSCCCRRT